ncbi:hypothetical protein ETAA8_66980 [Anatilimnocola aggregata]|uniref:Uncharacterized protein n=1 Tax=Anatilimnocola aggregata TaxID=2528021 RepID=A0A517YMT5_9BACT|nr:hypothetical protein [Anatilimnocola aggregata]QDU31539.1 hypothetical protein ETAA8_66980 [Anatilimnocola aggregata]
MNPRDFLSLAGRLATDTVEASQRTAISRANYAAFHQSRTLVEACGFKFANSGECHTKLPYCLQASNDTEQIVVAQKLDSLRRARNDADYNLTTARFLPPASVTRFVQTAHEISVAVQAAQSRLLTFRPLVRQYAASVLKKVLEGDE